ncbi:helix-turn-helix domain-containing protein [Neomesorhizobium albiziae]|nr:helix-turn-helix domain-containing protein [Mesorhizobium albiziae]
MKVTTRGALNLVGELGLREVTGTERYRAWGSYRVAPGVAFTCRFQLKS